MNTPAFGWSYCNPIQKRGGLLYSPVMVEFDVFVSYSNHDRAKGEAACAALEAQGVRCWIAPRDIQPGAEWGAAIVDAIDRCRVMVLIFSNSANESQQIRREVERAVHVGVPIVPFRIEDITPTKSLAYFLGSVHWLDAFTHPFESHLQQLVDAVKAFLENADTPSDRKSVHVASATVAAKQHGHSSPAVRKSGQRRGAVIAGAAAIAVIMGLIGTKVVFPSLFVSPPASVMPPPPDSKFMPSDSASIVSVPSRAPVDKGPKAQRNVTQAPTLTAREILAKYADSTVPVSAEWRLYDREYRQPLFHRVIQRDGRLYPAYVKLPSFVGGKIVRWLTTSDVNRRNIPIGSSGIGSGFVVSDQGLILTTKHVAAAWQTNFEEIGWDKNPANQACLFDYPEGGNKRIPLCRIVSLAEIAAEQRKWIPEDGGWVFHEDLPIVIAGKPNDRRVFQGRNEAFEVRFAGNTNSVQASLVRTANFSDAALIKVDMSGRKPVEMDPRDDDVEVGDRVMVLGYDMSAATFVRTSSAETGQARVEFVPEPTIIEGIIQTKGYAYQMTTNGIGYGNIGAPVFNAKGQVIGLITSTSSNGVAFVLPITDGRMLLR
jgi:S1-C subfamily serine protease